MFPNSFYLNQKTSSLSSNIISEDTTENKFKSIAKEKVDVEQTKIVAMVEKRLRGLIGGVEPLLQLCEIYNTL